MQRKFEEYVKLFRGKVMRRSLALLRQHQDIARNIFNPIRSFLGKKSCKVYVAPFDVRLPEATSQISDEHIYTVVRPDVCIICDPARLDRPDTDAVAARIIAALGRYF